MQMKLCFVISLVPPPPSLFPEVLWGCDYSKDSEIKLSSLPLQFAHQTKTPGVPKD